MSTRVAGLLVMAGLLLVAAGMVQYVLARARQREEQAGLDRHWAEVQRKAAQQFPHPLPGERPAPAPLRGLLLVVGLVGAGVAVCLVGLAAIAWRSGVPSGP